ncbi:MAG: 2-amino-4-hydroxy-6-hydroxymethyldihydropteridine diphosphokinase [Chitinophagaceae bacterium]|nr:2-amino-4-hydroxy-6-hydroxymethyldihydropteridine diphosphokinase [Chitinophagaceae bacterium]
MNKGYLLIGGNLGDRKLQLEKARTLIENECGTIVRRSHLYETAPWGNTDQPSFFNQALMINTSWPAFQLLGLLLQIEARMGRQRTQKYGPRNIDIDMLLFNDEIIHTPALEVPHPQLPYRRFALEPLDEIAPDVIHPVREKTIHRLLKECNDPLSVWKLEN